jgi:hypothetical protein
MKNEKREGKFRSYHVSPFVRDGVAYHRGAGTMNTALDSAINLALTAMHQGARPEIVLGEENAALHLNEFTVGHAKDIAKKVLGHEVSIEDSIRVVLALAAEAKE